MFLVRQELVGYALAEEEELPVGVPVGLDLLPLRYIPDVHLAFGLAAGVAANGSRLSGWPGRQMSESVVAGFDHHKGVKQVDLGVECQDSVQLVMQSIESGRCQPKVDDAGRQTGGEYEAAVVAVTREQDAAVTMCPQQNVGVGCLGKTYVAGNCDVVTGNLECGSR